MTESTRSAFEKDIFAKGRMKSTGVWVSWLGGEILFLVECKWRGKGGGGIGFLAKPLGGGF